MTLMNADFISPLPAFAVRASNDRKTEQREQFSAFHFHLVNSLYLLQYTVEHPINWSC